MVMMDLTDDQLIDVIHRLLTNGVPPSAIAKSFDLDPTGIRDIQSHIRVTRYGTDELTEAMNFLIWDAYDSALTLMHEGTPANKMRMVGLVLSRSISIAGRQSPESMDKMRDFLIQLAADVGNTPVAVSEPGPFVVAHDN